jgi:hypothetical protein
LWWGDVSFVDAFSFFCVVFVRCVLSVVFAYVVFFFLLLKLYLRTAPNLELMQYLNLHLMRSIRATKHNNRLAELAKHPEDDATTGTTGTTGTTNHHHHPDGSSSDDDEFR